MTVRDVSKLSLSVRERANIQDNGEVVWPLDNTETAINALADTRQIILGLDFWEYDEEHRIQELPWTSYEPEGESTDVENGRRAALAELRRAKSVLSLTPEHWILITW
jgi:hypothetical protein